MSTALEYHPLANLFPLIEGKDFEEFCAGIKADGRLHDKIVLLDGQILDGRNRYRACTAVGLTPHSRTFDPKVEGDPLTFVMSKNLHRRHLNESQRAMVAAKLANMPAHRPVADKSANLPTSQADAAKLLNVSTRLVTSAKAVEDKAGPELRRAVEQGQIAVSAAAQAAALPSDVQVQVAEHAASGRMHSVQTILKAGARKTKERALGEKLAALPDKKFGVILADPEWEHVAWSPNGMLKAAGNHYPTSATDKIAGRSVETIAADDCVLFLWAVVPMLPDALKVMAAWGFTYKSHFVWEKLYPGARQGMGYWARINHELLLIGTRGNKLPAPAPGTQAGSIIKATIGAHSEKPEASYALIEAYFPTLPKIELNARRVRAGWTAWGNEAPDHLGGAADMVPPHDPETGEIIEQQSESIGQAVVTAGAATSPVIADDDERRKATMADGSVRETAASPERAAHHPNGGGDHEVTGNAALQTEQMDTSDGAGDGGPIAQAVSPTSADLDIPTFLRRGHADCVVPS